MLNAVFSPTEGDQQAVETIGILLHLAWPSLVPAFCFFVDGC